MPHAGAVVTCGAQERRLREAEYKLDAVVLAAQQGVSLLIDQHAAQLRIQCQQLGRHRIPCGGVLAEGGAQHLLDLGAHLCVVRVLAAQQVPAVRRGRWLV